MVIKVSAQQSRITYLKYFRKAVAGNFADEPIQMISLNIKWLTSFGKRETNENYNNTTVQLQEPPLQTNDESCLRCNENRYHIAPQAIKRKRGGSFISQISSFHPKRVVFEDGRYILIKDF